LPWWLDYTMIINKNKKINDLLIFTGKHFEDSLGVERRKLENPRERERVYGMTCACAC